MIWEVWEMSGTENRIAPPQSHEDVGLAWQEVACKEERSEAPGDRSIKCRSLSSYISKLIPEQERDGFHILHIHADLDWK